MQEGVLERANDVFLSYYAAAPHRPRPPAKLQFAPYQMLLSSVAGPEMVRRNTPTERFTHQLFCSSTGSGKSITILNSAWQYACSWHRGLNLPYRVVVVAPDPAKQEVLNQLVDSTKPVPIPGLAAYITHFSASWRSQQPPLPQGDGAEAQDARAKAQAALALEMEKQLKKRNLEFMTYLQLYNRTVKKSGETLGPATVLLLDEAHALVDAQAASNQFVNDDMMAEVRQWIYEQELAACLLFTWTPKNPVCLMVMLRGRAWGEAQDPKITAADWPAVLPSGHDAPNWPGNAFYVRDATLTAKARDAQKRLAKLSCPVKPLESAGDVVRDRKKLLRLFSGHVFYLDISGDLYLKLETAPLGEAPPLSPEEEEAEHLRQLFLAGDPSLVSTMLRKAGYKGSLRPWAESSGARELETWYAKMEETPCTRALLKDLWAEFQDFEDLKRGPALRRYGARAHSAQALQALMQRVGTGATKEGPLPSSFRREAHRAPSGGSAAPAPSEDGSGGRVFLGDTYLHESHPYWSSKAYKDAHPREFVRHVLANHFYGGSLPVDDETETSLRRWCRRSEAVGDAVPSLILADLLYDVPNGARADCATVAKAGREIASGPPRAEDPDAQFVVPSFYGWRTPQSVVSVVPTAAQIDAWRRAHNGDFARLRLHAPIYVPSQTSDEIKQLRKRMRLASFAPTPEGKFSMFPLWQGVAGKDRLTEENACALQKAVDLESFLDGAHGFPEAARLLRKLLRCRAPKLAELVALLEGKVERPGEAPMYRNTEVYLPVRRDAPRMFELFAQILSVALGLSVDDAQNPSARPSRAEDIAEGHGWVFALSDKPEDKASNRSTLKAFFSLSRPHTRNVLVLSYKNYQSADAAGANTMVRLQPYPLARAQQIIGRAHRRGAQREYPPPAVLDSYEIFYTPEEGEEAQTALSCDSILTDLYDASTRAERETISVMEEATFACAAMDFLHRQGLGFLPAQAECAHSSGRLHAARTGSSQHSDDEGFSEALARVSSEREPSDYEAFERETSQKEPRLQQEGHGDAGGRPPSRAAPLRSRHALAEMLARLRLGCSKPRRAHRR